MVESTINVTKFYSKKLSVANCKNKLSFSIAYPSSPQHQQFRIDGGWLPSNVADKHVCFLVLNIYSYSTKSSAIAEGPRDASCQLKSCQLPRNSAETTCTTSPDRIDGGWVPSNVADKHVCYLVMNIYPYPTKSSAIAEGPLDASCQLESCQLPRNSAVWQVLKSRSYEVGGLRWADVL